MADTVRIRPVDNTTGTFGANINELRERAALTAVQRYFNKDRISNPQAMALTASQGGMFDGLRDEAFRSGAPRSAYSDVV
ncbi:hypothetical protein [Streptomyces sp. NPDC059411]|uniref:hypothetical protein n=1 Tax=Streptomyces sp. NPDC059411 TaxID=3346825 RepID=UPI0036BCECCC